MKILVFDNYDSFTFNVVQLIEMIGYKVKSVRNDEITLAEIEKMNIPARNNLFNLTNLSGWGKDSLMR